MQEGSRAVRKQVSEREKHVERRSLVRIVLEESKTGKGVLINDENNRLIKINGDLWSQSRDCSKIQETYSKKKNIGRKKSESLGKKWSRIWALYN